MHTIQMLFPISRMLRMSRRTDLLVEVTNLTMAILYGHILLQQVISLQIFICLDLYPKKVLELKPTVLFSNE